MYNDMWLVCQYIYIYELMLITVISTWWWRGISNVLCNDKNVIVASREMKRTSNIKKNYIIAQKGTAWLYNMNEGNFYPNKYLWWVSNWQKKRNNFQSNTLKSSILKRDDKLNWIENFDDIITIYLGG